MFFGKALGNLEALGFVFYYFASENGVFIDFWHTGVK
jgi:hypothetical protein